MAKKTIVFGSHKKQVFKTISNAVQETKCAICDEIMYINMGFMTDSEEKTIPPPKKYTLAFATNCFLDLAKQLAISLQMGTYVKK